MTKKNIAILLSAVLVIGIGTAVLMNQGKASTPEKELEGPVDVLDYELLQQGLSELDGSSVEEETAYVVPPIVPDKKSGSSESVVIVEEAIEAQAPEVIVTTNENGETVQTPNWEAQKELKEGTDLTDPDTVPEYKEESPNNNTGGGTPKNGDEKYIDGELYGYVEGFGWVKYGGPAVVVNDHSDLELTGNKVGY